MSLTNYGENWMLNAFKAGGTYYLGLFTSAPGEAGGGTEVSGGAYAVSGVSCLRLLRIRCACGESSAHTLEVAMPSIKGHNWNDEVQGMRDWAPISEAHKTNWRGIVQWP